MSRPAELEDDSACPGDTSHIAIQEQRLASLHRAHAPALLGFLYRLCGNSSDAEDIAQEAFLTAFNRLEDIEADKFRSYLFSVGSRKCLHLFRKRRLLKKLGLDQPVCIEEMKPIAQAGASQEELSELFQVFRFLETIPAADRLAWSLRKIEGNTIEEISVTCRCSTSTVKRRIQKVDKLLEEHYRENQP